jgi:hypothetical protein
MKKLLILSLVLLMIVGFGTAALAKADKQTLVPYPFTAPIEPDASGKAVVNDSMGNVVLEITVSARGLIPGEVYTVYLGKSGGPYFLLDTFTAKKNGKGNFHVNLLADGALPDLECVNIMVNNSAGYTMLVDEDL